MKVEPIRDKELIGEIVSYLKGQYDKRNYMLFILGTNTGLRISDILKLKVEDVKDIKHLNLKEQKTQKHRRFLINSALRVELDKYIKGMNDGDYLFKSRQGGNVPISRVQAYNILQQIAERFNLENLGTHTLRKTFGYWHYKQFKDVALLQRIFNHSSPVATLIYIGIEQDEIDLSIDNFNIGI